MEAAQALMKYKQKTESMQALMKYKQKTESAKSLMKYKQKMESKKQTKIPILYSTQREIEWFKKLCPNFDQNIHNIKYLKTR
jgi:hypothetical protein